MTQTIDLFEALGLKVGRRVASGRYLTATAGPAHGWYYFATYRVRSGFWFGVRREDGDVLRRSEIALFEKEGFALTNKNLEAIRLVGATLIDAAKQSELVMDELKEILAAT